MSRNRPTLSTGLANTNVLFGRNLRLMGRNQTLLFFTFTQPAMFVLLFTYVIGSSISSSRGAWVQYLVPGVAALSVAFACGSSAVGLAEDRRTLVMDRFWTLPIARSSVLAARVAADTVRSLVVVGVVVLTGTAVGFQFHGGVVGLLQFFGVLGLFSVAMNLMAANIGLAVPNAETAQASLYSWLYPLTFVSAVFVKPEFMPGPLQYIAERNPISFLSDSARALVAGRGSGPLLAALAWALGLIVVFGPLAVWQFSRRATTSAAVSRQ